MQTFLTNPDSFTASAQTLDNRRLNKQILEAWQILMTNLKLNSANEQIEPKGWVNHPATKMWTGCEWMLYAYIIACGDEWHRRGFQSIVPKKAGETVRTAVELGIMTPTDRAPIWWSNSEHYANIAKTHRIALLAKDYEWYSQFGWDEDYGSAPEDYQYLWLVSGYQIVT